MQKVYLFLYSFIKLSIAVIDDFVTLIRFIENKIMILLMLKLKLLKNLVERLIQTFVSWPVCRDLNAASSIKYFKEAVHVGISVK